MYLLFVYIYIYTYTKTRYRRPPDSIYICVCMCMYVYTVCKYICISLLVIAYHHKSHIHIHRRNPPPFHGSKPSKVCFRRRVQLCKPLHRASWCFRLFTSLAHIAHQGFLGAQQLHASPSFWFFHQEQKEKINESNMVGIVILL